MQTQVSYIEDLTPESSAVTGVTSLGCVEHGGYLVFDILPRYHIALLTLATHQQLNHTKSLCIIKVPLPQEPTQSTCDPCGPVLPTATMYPRENQTSPA